MFLRQPEITAVEVEGINSSRSVLSVFKRSKAGGSSSDGLNSCFTDQLGSWFHSQHIWFRIMMENSSISTSIILNSEIRKFNLFSTAGTFINVSVLRATIVLKQLQHAQFSCCFCGNNLSGCCRTYLM